MHLTTHLAEIRGKRTIREIADASGVHEATIRQVEQGKMLPREAHVEPLERAYGRPWPQWYSRLACTAIQEGDKP